MSPALSLQLYTLSAELEADLEGSLDRLGALGLRNVEPYHFTHRTAELAAAFSARWLKAPTAHACLLSTELPDDDGNLVPQPPQREVFAAAQRLGITTVIDPFVVPERWLSADDVAETAARLNAATALGAEYGLRVGYHNHAHELTSQIDGRYALEVFADQLDDAVVLEIDTYWAAYAGVDVPALLRRLGDRVVALHVKDGPLGDDPLEQVPAGQGAVDIPAVLAAAPSAEYAVVEFDRVDGDVFAAIGASLDYLRGLGL